MRGVFVAIAVIGLTASFRFLALTGFSDDHYVHLAGAQQMLHGAWPSRDFVDLGAPLTYAVSAAAQRIFGDRQLTEAVLMALAFGAAALLTLRAGVALTGSLLAALIAVIIEVLIFPRTYSYPKMIIYAAAALAMIWYAERPSRVRVVVLAALAVTALLIRHDHGVFVGAAAALAIALSPIPGDRWRGGMSVALFVAVALALSLPYVFYLESADGLIAHLRRGVLYAQLERQSQRLNLDGVQAHEVWLMAVTWAVPLMAIAVSVVRARSGSWMTVRKVVPLAVLAFILNAGLIRDLVETRLPDVIVPPALLMAWLVQQAWATRPLLSSLVLRTTSVTVVAITIWSASVMGHTPEQLDRIGMFNGIERLPSRFAERADEMRRPWTGRQAPSAAVRQMQPFFEYVGRCVPPESRLLVPAFLPEIPVLAHRAFAGGQISFRPHALATASDHALVMHRLAAERVPIVVIRRPTYDDIAMEFPELDAYIKDHFSPLADWPLGGDDRVILLADTHAAAGRDGVTGWPCFR